MPISKLAILMLLVVGVCVAENCFSCPMQSKCSNNILEKQHNKTNILPINR
jgi:hypothetical protein